MAAGRGPPGHGVDVQGRGDHFGENAGTGRGAAEVAHELRMRPVRHVRER